MNSERPSERADPSAAEVRAALERILSDPIFSKSTQLANFLRFVVEAAIAGDTDRLKGYTIATRALGRDETFDPQTDPIVRVEAGRLRQSLERYYTGPGRDDAVVIELPRGSYVPRFRRSEPEGMFGALKDPHQSGGSQASHHLKLAALGLLITLAVGGSLKLALDVWPDLSQRAVEPFRTGRVSLQASSPFPVVSIERFDAGAAQRPDVVSRLQETLRDALDKFSEIDVLSGTSESQTSPGGRRINYRLSAVAENSAGGTPRLNFRLVDAAEGIQFWSRSFDLDHVSEDEIVRQVAASIGQPYGVIHTRNRLRRTAGHAFDPRYGCWLDAFGSWASDDLADERRVRACLLRETAADPTFSHGFAALAISYFREHLYDPGETRPSDPPLLERALEAAQRAVNLNPQSARAYQILMEVHFYRGEREQMLAAAQTANALNPYDLSIPGSFGVRLIQSGEVEQGLWRLRGYVETRNVSLGSRITFTMFLAAHLTGDRAAAAIYAGQMPNPSFQPGCLARALAAAQAGERERAVAEFNRLKTLNPRWSGDARAELRRLFPIGDVATRLARDLVEAGLIPLS